VLSDIAKNDSASGVRKAAVEKLTDQYALADVAKNDNERDVREAAVKKPHLTDQRALADVAKNDRYFSVRRAAFEKLTEPEALRSVAEKYLSDIRSIEKGECGEDGWQKVESLILIAKKYPQFFKENWRQINRWINALHKDVAHDDYMEGFNCHYDMPGVNETVASKGLHFPPYTFND
jgi:hypothetical protein